ncbi:MAG: ABC transporter ATP-binding protein [Pelomonas sp.]|nr:ABC transporter ATP-binding protein [Roseateles sp.]MBV8604389.1 ABC transporter ATP-binding protein [Roseateles sp.]
MEAATLTVDITGLTKRYRIGRREVLALDRVSLQIRQGEYLAITGRSGSGKSSLLHLIGCLDRPDAGLLAVCGARAEQADADELARIRSRFVGFVFQQFNLLATQTALENVMLPLVYADLPRGTHADLASRALREVGLEDWADHLPSQLSGGQQQRVAIARALVRQPRLLLADEPTGALDSATAIEVLALLDAIHAKGVTIVLVTHDPQVAARARREVRLHDGRIASDLACG